MTQVQNAIRNLNERAQLFWTKQGELRIARLENPAIREAAFAALRADWERGVPAYFQKTLEHQLQLAAEAHERFQQQTRELGGANEIATSNLASAGHWAKYREAQRIRAQRPRSKVITDGKTFPQIINEFASRPEYRDQTTKEIWPPFFSELERLDLSPEELTHPDDLRKSAYTYTDDLKGDKQKITYGRFANIISAARRQKKSR